MPNTVQLSLPERIVTFVEASSAMAEKAASAEQVRQQQEKQAEALIPGIIDTLAAITIEGERGPVPLLDPDEKTACVDALKDPVRALHILTRVAGHFKAAQADRLGRGETGRREKKAGVGEQSPYAGRRTSEESPAWQNFRRSMLGN
jgi:hypothetical protein